MDSEDELLALIRKCKDSRTCSTHAAPNREPLVDDSMTFSFSDSMEGLHTDNSQLIMVSSKEDKRRHLQKMQSHENVLYLIADASAEHSIEDSSVYVSTAEKWNEHVLRETQPFKPLLVIVDDLLYLGNADGHLDVLLSELRPETRLVLFCGHVSNQKQLVGWLSSHRPLLTASAETNAIPQVLSFYKGMASSFVFDASLNKQVYLLLKERQAACVLVRCPTKRSTTTLANHLVKHGFASRAHVRTLHGGMPGIERESCEMLFASGEIKVLCTTMGLRLSPDTKADLIVIKDTHSLPANGAEQMQLLKREIETLRRSGTLFILTEHRNKKCYERMLSSNEKLRSGLSASLHEHILQRIVVSRLATADSVLAWARKTFLATETEADCKAKEVLKHLTESSLVAEDNKGRLIAASEASLVFVAGAKAQMLPQILKLGQNDKPRDILWKLCYADCFAGLGLSSDGKELAKIQAMAKPLFPVKGRLTTLGDRVFVLVQLGMCPGLGRSDMVRAGMRREIAVVCKTVSDSLDAAKEHASRQRLPTTLRNILELKGSLLARTWNVAESILATVDGLGHVYASALIQNGILSFSMLRRTDARTIELLLRRKPPFGTTLHAAIEHMPRLDVTFSYENALKATVRTGRHGLAIGVLVWSQEHGKEMLFFQEHKTEAHTALVLDIEIGSLGVVHVSLLATGHLGINEHRKLVIRGGDISVLGAEGGLKQDDV
eukprot:GHVN01000090.1.p2 GENE.GHVN01000090.1~~GHVN01000090.1.p2  ORF type:complete len:722 (-),score=78.56 GHVN01000090.1:7944-10109(-)